MNEKSNLKAPHYYSFSNTNEFKINSDSYRRFIRPQLESILYDFRNMIKNFDPISKNILTLRQDYLNLKELLLSRLTDLNTKNSEEDLLDLIKKTQNFLIRLQGFEKLGMKLIADNKQLGNVKLNIIESKAIGHLQLSIERLITHLEIYLMTTDTILSRKQFGPHYWPSIINEVDLYFVLAIVELVPSTISENISQLLDGFILPLEALLGLSTQEEQIAFLLLKLKNLNFAWNIFHLNLEQKAKYVNSGTILATTIQNRWNSILRIVLPRN